MFHKTCTALFLCLLIALSANAQVISGHVYQFGTDTPIADASVYFNGSTTGTRCNNDGFFKLNTNGLTVPLTVSCVGYYSETLATYSVDKEIAVFLKPKMLQEVTIKPGALSREVMVKLFITEFLGTSATAQSCAIKNIDDIDMDYDQATHTFTVASSKPILISNKKLGYTITYYLDRFVRTGNHIIFDGNYSFKEDSLPNKAEAMAAANNREAAYAASRMQFIRALWHNNLKAANYEIWTYDNRKLPADSIIISKGTKTYVRINKWIRVFYKQDYDHPSFLTPKTDTSLINADGFYTSGLSWAGPMANQRVGDMLPFEYRSAKELYAGDKPQNPILRPVQKQR